MFQLSTWSWRIYNSDLLGIIMQILITNNTKSIHILNPQKGIGTFVFPFTGNLCIGCSSACKYCFISIALRRPASRLFTSIEVKANFADILHKEIRKYATLPQNLKRIQMNESSDPYSPQVLHHMQKEMDANPLLQMYEHLKTEWGHGNKWMMHILTKSHLITKHLSQLEEIKEMVQIELSFCSSDETVSRTMESYTSSIKRRFETIEKLSAKGIFVRVMAMPFYDDHAKTEAFRKEVLNRGAQAFKHKKLNYYDWQTLSQTSTAQLLNDELKRTTGKQNEYFEDLLLKSGEPILVGGKPQTTIALLPNVKMGENWAVVSKLQDRLSLQNTQVVDMGYSSINNVDWGYIK